MKTMVLSDGVAYVEAPEPDPSRIDNCCADCDLHMTPLCDESTLPSIEVFGGDCCEREVIYIKADPQPVKE